MKFEIVKVTSENKLQWESEYLKGRSRYTVGTWLALDENGAVFGCGHTKRDMLAQLNRNIERVTA